MRISETSVHNTTFSGQAISVRINNIKNDFILISSDFMAYTNNI